MSIFSTAYDGYCPVAGRASVLIEVAHIWRLRDRDQTGNWDEWHEDHGGGIWLDHVSPGRGFEG